MSPNTRMVARQAWSAHRTPSAEPAPVMCQQLLPGEERIPDRNGGLAQQLEALGKGVPQRLPHEHPCSRHMSLMLMRLLGMHCTARRDDACMSPALHELMLLICMAACTRAMISMQLCDAAAHARSYMAHGACGRGSTADLCPVRYDPAVKDAAARIAWEVGLCVNDNGVEVLLVVCTADPPALRHGLIAFKGGRLAVQGGWHFVGKACEPARPNLLMWDGACDKKHEGHLQESSPDCEASGVVRTPRVSAQEDTPECNCCSEIIAPALQ